MLFSFRRLRKSGQRTLIPPPDLRHAQPHHVGDVAERLELDVSKHQNLDVNFIQREPRNECAAAVDGANSLN